MKNRDKWKPTKFAHKKGKLRASRDPREVGVSSRLVADLVANLYHENLQHHAKGRLLDLGCGKVPLFSAYKDYISENICVDWENSLHKNEYLDFECDITKPLPFQDKEFDTIILADVLEHIPQPESLWNEISSILSVDGKIIMNVPFFYCLHEQPHDYYRYTEFSLRRFTENAGLKVIKLESIGGSPEIITDIFAKHIVRVSKIGRLLAILSQWITFHFIQTSVGKKVSVATRSSFPLGYFVIAQKTE
ncbi:MAG: class I SAM-dependent methyltransferase [Candidatus Electrothrix sp. AUS4]|nr:class I SAM-dependent methyltransferase [Candidatus Electrothrix sp. AUS4]